MVVTWGLRSVFLLEVATFVLVVIVIVALMGSRSARDE